jgi:hypothetical protein
MMRSFEMRMNFFFGVFWNELFLSRETIRLVPREVKIRAMFSFGVVMGGPREAGMLMVICPAIFCESSYIQRKNSVYHILYW